LAPEKSPAPQHGQSPLAQQKESALNTKPNENLTIIVMGLDKYGRPRAAVYPSDKLAMATTASTKWKLPLGRAESDAALAVAKDLPNGANFPSEKLDAPTVKRETYNLLLKTITCEGVPNDKAVGGGTAEKSKTVDTRSTSTTLSPWDMIQVGSVVLACVDRDEGYFACRVEKISGPTLTLRWKDFPKLPPFNHRRLAVGLLATGK